MPDSYVDSVWVRAPRTRSGQPSLTREQIVRAAIDLLDAEGAAGLSMRRLGTRLGSGATSLYWHVAHKDELLELVVDEVLGEVYVPEAGDTPWRVGLSVSVNGLRAMLLRHPWVIGLLGTHPTLGPNAMRMGDRLTALLTDAGFEGLEMAHASSLLNGFTVGSATTQSAAMAALKRSGTTFAEMAKQIEPYLDRMAPDHPHYDKWRRENNVLAADPHEIWDKGFAFGLDRLLDGLESWLTTRTPSDPTPAPAKHP
jgi:AcrR family transcriptional regulator